MAQGRTNINLTEIFAGYEQLVNYKMLYDSGDECVSATGGWNQWFIYGTGTVTKNTNNIYGYGYTTSTNNWNGAKYGTLNPVDMADYDNLHYYGELYLDKNGSRGSGIAIHIKSIKDTAVGTNSNDILAEKTFTASANAVVKNEMRLITIEDITDISSGYVGVLTHGTSSRKGESYMHNMILTKNDDFATLCVKASISVPTDITTLVADETSISAILNNEDTVNFMIRQCTGNFMVAAVQSSTFRTALESSPYKTLIQGNEHWAKFLAMVA